MSDILIKGIKMPKQCGYKYCPFSLREESFNGKLCGIRNRETLYDRTTKDVKRWCICLNERIEEAMSKQKRLDNCPFVELPPHGRLIDADNEIKRLDDAYCTGCDNWNGIRCKTCDVSSTKIVIDNAPTVLEANNG